jgi:hypothetical protein
MPWALHIENVACDILSEIEDRSGDRQIVAIIIPEVSKRDWRKISISFVVQRRRQPQERNMPESARHQGVVAAGFFAVLNIRRDCDERQASKN